MKKPILAVAFVATLTALAFISRAAAPPNRPPGVAAGDWVQLNDRFGFVIVHSPAAPFRGDATGLYLTPPTSGYFMLKGVVGWSRVVIVEPIKGPSAAG